MTDRTLRATDVATAIAKALARNMTKEQLGDWAHQAFLDDDTGSRTIDHRSSTAINHALQQLIVMSEGPEWEIDDDELQTMMEQLKRVES